MSLRPKLQLKRRFDYLKFWSYLYHYAGCHISTKFSTTTATTVSSIYSTATTTIYTNVLPSTSTNTEIEDSSKSKKKPAGANPQGIRRGRKPYPIDADGNKIRPEKENQKTGQNKRNQYNNLAKNFLLTNFALIAQNNLNI